MDAMAKVTGRACAFRLARSWWHPVPLMVPLLATILCGCPASTGTTIRRVEVPVPYWEAPAGIQPLPEPPRLKSKELTQQEAVAAVLEALRLVAEDLRACLEDDAMVRHLYSELAKLCSEPPPPLPTPAPP